MWLLPSRQRPESLKRFFDAYRETGADSPGVVWLDDDDYDKYMDINLPKGWFFIINEPMDGTGPITNAFLERYPNEPWYGLLGDDVIPRTQGWDKKLIAAAGSNGVAYGNDLINAERHAAHPVVGGDMVRSLGWLALPGCKRIYIDDALMEVAKRRGTLKYIPEVVLEHMHYTAGKSQFDDTYAKPGMEEDAAIYKTWLKSIEKPVTFVCVNWGNYCGRGAEYVNKLYDMVRRNLPDGYPGRFVCFTDNNDGLSEYVDAQALPEGIAGWWNKLALFSPDLFAEGERIVYLDLDTVITGSLDEIITYDGEFAVLRDFYHPERVGPGVMLWRDGFGAEIWNSYERAGFPTDLPLGDLSWINKHFAETDYKPHILQDLFPQQFVSYKAHAQLAIPKGAKVVCFHGEPRPHEAGGWVDYIWKIGGGSALELETFGNTSDDRIIDNIRHSLTIECPLLEMQPEHDGHAVIVGGAPSLNNSIDEIEWRKAQGQDIFCVNNSWLKVPCDYHVMLDARPENADFVPPDKKYIYASQCHPDVFANVPAELTIWHSYVGGIEHYLQEEKRQFSFVMGGSTVGLKALCIAYIMGYRQMHIYGMDSCYALDAHHAYPQALNDNERVIDLVCNEKAYRAAPWMVTQVEEFKELSAQLIGLGCTITVHGDGLLQDVAKLMAA